MVRLIAVACFAAVLVATSSSNAEAKYASIVIDAESGEVLYARNADTRNYPASLTKLMTLYLTFEALETGRLSLGEALRVSVRAAGQAPSRLGLSKGQTITVNEAILALVTKSANDVATVLAEALGGTEWKFTQIMTEKAKLLGMDRTSFRNASGLPDKGQLSSARDMATLALALWRDFPQHYHYFSAEAFAFGSKTYRSHNRLLSNYEGTDGLKTGYTHASGFNIAVSVEREGHRLIAVVFGGKTADSRDAHLVGLLDDAFATLEERDRQTAVGDADLRTEGKVALAAASPAVMSYWGIQVGAYASISSATLAIKMASAELAHLLEKAVAVLMPIERGGLTLYRARFFGMTREQAQDACWGLVGTRVPCAVIRHQENAETLPVSPS